MKVELQLQGMSCNHCKNAVIEVLDESAGVTASEVELGRAVIETPDFASIRTDLERALAEEGYPVTSAAEMAG